MLDNNLQQNEFVIQRRVRFGDCDPGGVFYTANIGDYVVESVRDFMDYLIGSPMEKSILAMGVAPPAKSISCEFFSFMKWDDELHIKVSVDHIGSSSFSFSVAACCEGRRVFEASLTQVCIDIETQQTIKIPEKLFNILNNAMNST